MLPEGPRGPLAGGPRLPWAPWGLALQHAALHRGHQAQARARNGGGQAPPRACLSAGAQGASRWPREAQEAPGGPAAQPAGHWQEVRTGTPPLGSRAERMGSFLHLGLVAHPPLGKPVGPPGPGAGPPDRAEAEGGGERGGRGAELRRRAGSPGGWGECDCLLLRQEGRRAGGSSKSQSGDRQQDGLGRVDAFSALRTDGAPAPLQGQDGCSSAAV